MKSTVRAAFKVVFVAAATTLAWFSVPVALVAISATIIVALHGKAGDIIEFSFGPLKAKLERNLSEAEQLVGKLRELASLQVRAIIASGVRTGRWADDESTWLYDQIRSLEQGMKAVGVTEQELREGRSEFVRYTIADAGSAAMGRSRIPMSKGKGVETEWREALNPFPDRDPDKIEAFLNKWGLMDSERAVRLADMRWMREHGDIRDADQYRRAQKAVPWTGIDAG